MFMVTINVSHHWKAILWSEVGFHMECKYRLRNGKYHVLHCGICDKAPLSPFGINQKIITYQCFIYILSLFKKSGFFSLYKKETIYNV